MTTEYVETLVHLPSHIEPDFIDAKTGDKITEGIGYTGDIASGSYTMFRPVDRYDPAKDERYPEHAKLHRVKDQTQAVGEFFEWCETKGYFLAEWDSDSGSNRAKHVGPLTKLLAEWVGIDTEVLEAEKDAMLEAQRALNKRVAAGR